MTPKPTKSSLPVKNKTISPKKPLNQDRTRYYSSSSEEDEVSPAQKAASNKTFLNKLESFNSGFWMDSEKEEDDGEDEDNDR